MSTPRQLDFEALISPVPAQEFFSRYWEREPLVLASGDAARYGALLTADDLHTIIPAACSAEDSTVELLGDAPHKGGLGVRVADDATDVYDSYGRPSAGATVRVNHVERRWRPLLLLCGRLEQYFGFPLRANLYWTPPRSRGAELHYDTHDILVLQISGRKSWRIFPPVVALPLEHVPPLAFEERKDELKYYRGGPRRGRADIRDEAGEALRECTLEAGDLLYLPRGFPHEAWSSEEPSLHVTLGIHALTWLDLIAVALGQAANADERFRRALPVGFACEPKLTVELEDDFRELLRSFGERAGARAAFEETAASFMRSREATAGDDDASAEKGDAGRISLESVVERRPGLLCRLVVEGGMVGLASSARGLLWMPSNFEEAMRFVARTARFRVGELPGGMSEHGKLAFVRRLVEDGFLRTESDRYE